MASTALRSPASLAALDLNARQAVWLACASMAAITVVDIAVNQRIGLLFGASFVLVAITIPLSVNIGELFVPAILPPLLLIGTITVLTVIIPSSIQVDGLADSAGALQRIIAGIIGQAAALVVGHLLALGVIGLRILTAPAVH
ncbi:MAG TPA: DUF6542 domain-containing protein [Aeromicrobium sp.]|nr:DUF6542 domain-containing protein [Aeromicrobium sp.]